MDTPINQLREDIAAINNLIYGNWMTQITYVFAEMGIADVLAVQAKNLDDMAESLAVNPGYLKRYLRCACNLGLASYDKTTQLYHLARKGELLTSSHPNSRREEARLNGAAYRYQPWGNLIHILKNGMSEEYSPTYKNGSLDYLKDKPELLNTFNKAMSEISVAQNLKIIKDYSFAGFTKVLDIGSGEGSFVKSILDKEPHLQGFMFDLEGTFESIIEPQFENRLNQLYGSFFDSVPDCADVYTMKNVIHNWPEDKVVKLLENTRDAMLSTSGIDTDLSKKRLLIVENILPEDDEESIANWMDLNFMILIDGAERTLNEYAALAGQCGFKLTNAMPTASGRHILEFGLLL